MTREDLRIFWQEDLDRFDASDFFREESRRMERYDNEVCPERWKKAVKYVRENGLNLIELFRRFGERKLVYPQKVLESLVGAYNEVQKIKKPDSVIIPLTLPFQSQGFSKALIKQLLAEKGDFGEGLKRNYALDDKIQGFSLVFGSSYNPAEGELDSDACLYGLPEQYETGDENRNIAVFILGTIGLGDLKSVSERRFAYTFGINPVKSGDDEGDEAVGEFVNLRELPKKAPPDRYGADVKAYYKRKPVREDAKNVPSRLREIYKNVMNAKKMGLFSDVKIFEIYSENVKLNKSYFMVSGFDVFGNELPYAYIPSENDID